MQMRRPSRPSVQKRGWREGRRAREHAGTPIRGRRIKLVAQNRAVSAGRGLPGDLEWQLVTKPVWLCALDASYVPESPSFSSGEKNVSQKRRPSPHSVRGRPGIAGFPRPERRPCGEPRGFRDERSPRSENVAHSGTNARRGRGRSPIPGRGSPKTAEPRRFRDKSPAARSARAQASRRPSTLAERRLPDTRGNRYILHCPSNRLIVTVPEDETQPKPLTSVRPVGVVSWFEARFLFAR